MSTRLEKWINGVSMSLLALFAIVFATQMWLIVKDRFKTSAMVWHGVKVLTPEVRVGGELVLEYSATVNEQCPAELRSFLRGSDGSVVSRWVTAGGYTPVSAGRRTIIVRIKVDDDLTKQFPALKNGPHTYEVTAIRFCPGGLEIDNLIPQARFTVVAP